MTPLLPLPDRTLLMGILNVTPDSFSDGGLHSGVEAAAARVARMVAEGADVIDVGAESTRPGHAPVPLDEELRRLLPVLERITPECPVPVSVDTTKAEVARRALSLGATLINDQWGLQGDHEMAAVAAEHGVEVIAMHNRSHPPFTNPMGEVVAFLRRSLEIADEAGLGRERVIVDPGFGFGKTSEQNLEVLGRLGELRELGRPILVGTSRKAMIRRGPGEPPVGRFEGTAATVALAIAFGARIVRVHEVEAMKRVAHMTDVIVRAGREAACS